MAKKKTVKKKKKVVKNKVVKNVDKKEDSIATKIISKVKKVVSSLSETDLNKKVGKLVGLKAEGFSESNTKALQAAIRLPGWSGFLSQTEDLKEFRFTFENQDGQEVSAIGKTPAEAICNAIVKTGDYQS